MGALARVRSCVLPGDANPSPIHRRQFGDTPLTGRLDSSWSIRPIEGTVAGLLAASADRLHLDGGRRLLVCRPTDEALVLGSSQLEPPSPPVAVPVHRRRSGGGAVWVDPDALTWLEFVLPAGDELWTQDLGRSFDWLGRVIAEALDDLGCPTTMHVGRAQPGLWGRTICFAGLGPGELLVGGRKVVGMSQRRTRRWCRFGVAVLHHFASDRYTAAFAVPEADRRTMEDHIGTVPADGLVDAVVGTLP